MDVTHHGASLWSSSEYDEGARHFAITEEIVRLDYYDTTNGLSLRCFKNTKNKSSIFNVDDSESERVDDRELT